MMLLQFSDGRSFAQGACTYSYRPAIEGDKHPRIIVGVLIEGIPTEAVVDTGGVYLVCSPEIAELLDLDPDSGLETNTMWIRKDRVAGTLHRLSLTLQATEGHSHQLDATAFVPRLQPHQRWEDLPSFMGLHGCLERIRFAVDPTTDTFYFGSTAEGD